MRGHGNALIGGLFFFGGIVITLATWSSAESGGRYVAAYGAIIFGFIQMARGLFEMSSEPQIEQTGLSGSNPQPARLRSGSILAEDYPARAAREGIEGAVVVGFTVDVNGRVCDAIVEQSSGDNSLDRAACTTITRRFRYYPAQDEYGKPVPDYKSQQVNWQLEG